MLKALDKVLLSLAGRTIVIALIDPLWRPGGLGFVMPAFSLERLGALIGQCGPLRGIWFHLGRNPRGACARGQKRSRRFAARIRHRAASGNFGNNRMRGDVPRSTQSKRPGTDSRKSGVVGLNVPRCQSQIWDCVYPL